LAVLCAVATFTILTAPRISPHAANTLRLSHDDFLREAQFEGIDWLPFGQGVITSARAQHRPVLLVIASPTSRMANFLDTRTFMDTEVAEYLNRNFVCSRIDGAIHPEWMNAMLPVTRLSNPFRPGVQIWALDSTGKAFDSVLAHTDGDDFSAPNLLQRLVEIKHEFDGRTSSEQTPSDLQRQDVQVILREAELATIPTRNPRAARAQVPNSFGLYSAVLRSIGQRSGGGFPVQGMLGLTPQVWRYLAMTGDLQTFQRAVIDGIIRSPMQDLLDGGFFHAMTLPDQTVEFEKLTVENADAMLALAEFGAINRDPMLRRVGEGVWRYLAGASGGPAGFVLGQQGDEGPRRRSKRYSVPARRLREAVRPELRGWAARSLGLDVAVHPQAVPYLAHDVLLDPRYSDVMEDLRRTAPLPMYSVDAGEADISLTCIARALQVARIWGDRGSAQRALGWLAPTELVRVGEDIQRRIGERAEGRGYLGDYLSYADAHLQAYLVTGDGSYFTSGLECLRRARSLFSTLTPGIWVLNQPDEVMGVPRTSVPEIADNLHESCSARAIRLLMAYGRLLGDSVEGHECIREAVRMTNSLRLIALSGGPQAAGYFCAAAEVFDPAFAMAVGPDAQELADALTRRAPARLVAAALGPVRPDLQSRPPGIYLLGHGTVGPLTLEEARQRLSAVYALGPRTELPAAFGTTSVSPHRP
jgi:uncharacterized protein YyaL (SSP411 family)